MGGRGGGELQPPKRHFNLSFLCNAIEQIQGHVTRSQAPPVKVVTVHMVCQ